MTRIDLEVKKLTSVFVRKGAKRNRAAQLGRMLTFAEFARQAGCARLAEVGRRQVLDFWNSINDLSDKTRYSYWCALVVLFELSEKSPPPKPATLAERLAYVPGGFRIAKLGFPGGTAAAGGKAPGGLGAEPRSLGGEAGAVALERSDGVECNPACGVT